MDTGQVGLSGGLASLIGFYEVGFVSPAVQPDRGRWVVPLNLQCRQVWTKMSKSKTS